MLRPFLMVVMTIFFSKILCAETWITTDTRIFRLKSGTNCEDIGKDNKQITCDCCLVRNAMVRSLSHTAALDECVTSYQCKFENVNDDDKSIESELVKAKHNLLSMTIVRIDKLKDPPALPEDGILTSEVVLQILEKLHREGDLPLPDGLFSGPFFRGPPPLSVKPLSENAKGLFCGQLFAIRYDPYYLDSSIKKPGKLRPLYIMKETKKGIKEIKHLYEINASPLRNEKIGTADQILSLTKPSSERIAKISFDDVHFKFKTGNNTRYFSLLQTAPGQSLHAYLKEFGEIATTMDVVDVLFQDAFKKIKDIFKEVGFSISTLHQKYAIERRQFLADKTFVHGDMHSENIFYDEETKTVTLIDNETFALSLKRPISGINDIVEFYVLHTLHTLAHHWSKQLTTNQEFGIDDYLWHELWRSLIEGYLLAYVDVDKKDFLILFEAFKKEFLHGLSHASIFDSIKDFSDQRKLKRIGVSLRRMYIKSYVKEEIFNRMLKTYPALDLKLALSGPNSYIRTPLVLNPG